MCLHMHTGTLGQKRASDLLEVVLHPELYLMDAKNLTPPAERTASTLKKLSHLSSLV